jgi:hypothetical protein
MALPKTAPKKKPAAKRRLSPAEQARIAELFARFEADESDPRTELNYASPYELVTAVALSAQATDVSVNKATAKLFRGRRHAAEDARPRREGPEAATYRPSASTT